MLTAHSWEHRLSDNALFNFGMVEGNVVIIDAGSRSNQPEITKGQFNTKVMKRFWTKAQTVVHPQALRLYKQVWQMAGERMATALETFETKWQEVLNNERQRNTVITTKIIRLGVCIATAWAQSSAQTRSLADYVSNAGQ